MGMHRAVLVVALSTTACGPGSYRDFRDQLVGAVCDWGERCGQVDKSDRARCPLDPVLAIFHDSVADHMMPGAVDIAASIDAGRMRYDSVNAQSCLDAVSGAPCDPMLAQRKIGLGCNAVVAPHTETDRACWGDAECTGGVCARAPGCAGQCTAWANFGDPCTDADSAPAKMRCDPTVAFCGPLAQNGDPICQQKKPQGATCDDTRECFFNWTCTQGTCQDPFELGENEACGGAAPCNANTYCDPNSGTCRPHHQKGETCNTSLACEDGLACQGLVLDDAGQVVENGICTPWLHAGAACAQPSPSGISGCPVSAPCAGGTCTASTSLASRGDDCSQRACGPALGCDMQKRCDFVAEVFGDCGGDRATLCDPMLTCMVKGAEGNCVPPDAPMCFFPANN
jgi:hypothetical protein